MYVHDAYPHHAAFPHDLSSSNTDAQSGGEGSGAGGVSAVAAATEENQEISSGFSGA